MFPADEAGGRAGSRGQGAGGREQEKEFLELGIPEEWIEPLMALGYDSVEKLKEVENPGKLANDLNGYKKKTSLTFRDSARSR